MSGDAFAALAATAEPTRLVGGDVASLEAFADVLTGFSRLVLDAADSIAPYLPTRYWLAFVDLFRDPILWRDVVRGVLLQVVYVVVFLGAGWANFMTKDVTD